MSKMGLHNPFGHLKHKLWSKEGQGIKFTVWFLTTNSRELTQFPCMQNTIEKLRRPKVAGVPTLAILVVPLGNPGIKNHLDVGPVGSHRLYYKGESGGFPQVRDVMSLVSSSCLWLVLTSKVFQLYTNHLVLVLCRPMWVCEACQFFLVPSWSSSMPLYPFEVPRAREHAPTLGSFVVFCLGLTFESFKELGACQIRILSKYY
jgi:hypothetical protein